MVSDLMHGFQYVRNYDSSIVPCNEVHLLRDGLWQFEAYEIFNMNRIPNQIDPNFIFFWYHWVFVLVLDVIPWKYLKNIKILHTSIKSSLDWPMLVVGHVTFLLYYFVICISIWIFIIIHVLCLMTK